MLTLAALAVQIPNPGRLTFLRDHKIEAILTKVGPEAAVPSDLPDRLAHRLGGAVRLAGQRDTGSLRLDLKAGIPCCAVLRCCRPVTFLLED